MPYSKNSSRREEFQILERYLADNGLKHSRQREIILGHFLSHQGHMAVDDLYQMTQRTHPEIGRTTVYRTLKLFCDAGLAEAIELKDGLTRFEHSHKCKHHDHMICTACGTIVEFTNDDIEKLQNEIAKSHDFTVHSHRHQIFGVCQKCSRRRRATSSRQAKHDSRRSDNRLSDSESIPTLS